MDNTKILELLTSGEELTTANILKVMLNSLIKQERDIHLEESSDNKANGYYNRSFGTSSGKITLDVPRDRNGEFKSQILPTDYKRNLNDKENLIKSLFAQGYSPNSISETLRQLGYTYSEKDLDKLKQAYLDTFRAITTKELKSDYLAVFIDAYNTGMYDQKDNKVKNAVVYSVLGVDMECKKDLLGIYVNFGNETKDYWLTVFNDLISRNMKYPLMIISDNFSGIRDAISAVYPKSFHQLCVVHLYRNIKRNMGKKDAAELTEFIKSLVISSSNHEESVKQLKEELLSKYKATYSSYIDFLLPHIEHYLMFKKLPSDIRRYFYTTNAAESFNSILERRRLASGGFFQSETTLNVNVVVALEKLNNKWKNGIHKIKPYMYEVHQLFSLTFGRPPIL